MKKTKKLMKKNTTGTRTTLNVLATKSAVASKIAIEIMSVLHMHNIVTR